MAIILRYFSELMNDVALKQLPRFKNLLLIVYDHIKRIYAIIHRLFWQNKLITRFDGRSWCIAYVHRLGLAEIIMVELGSMFNGRRRWPLHIRCRRKKVHVRYLIS